MTTRTNIAVAFLAGLVVAMTVAGAQSSSYPPQHNEFILRALASEVAGILARHDMTEVSRLDSSAQGTEVVLVRAPASVPAEQVIADVSSQEPSINSIEVAVLASLPEAEEDLDLNQVIGPVLGALGDTGTTLFGQDSNGLDRYVWRGYVEQAAESLVRASEARAMAQGAGAVVAIIDSGIDPDHALFAGHLVPGYDFLLDQEGDASEWGVLDESTVAILGESTVAILGGEETVALNESTVAILGDDQTDLLDPEAIPHSFGHGTMVAGIVHLVAPEAKIMPLRVFDGNGRGNVFDVARAIRYAVDHGATVINMSFSLASYSEELQRAVQYAISRGVVCVASVGNDGQNAIVYPARSLGVFGVASADASDLLSSFSNYGFLLASVAAPGEGIITAYPGGGWAAAWGTSFAAPWIAGAVALFADLLGAGSPGEVQILEVFDALSVSDPLYGPNAERVVYGRLDIKASLEHLVSADGGPLSMPTTGPDDDSDSD